MGSTSTGGTVVQTVNPSAALLAGQYESTAAQAAASAATTEINQALVQTQNQYTADIENLKPYTEEGVQALDQLNQLMGMSPYNPGTAPVAPTAPTAASEMSNISQADINNYILQNTSGVEVANNQGQQFTHLAYNGAGSTDPSVIQQYQSQWANVPAGEQSPGGVVQAASSSPIGQGLTISPFEQNTTISNDAANYLAQQLANQAQPQYQAALATYNQQNDLYNQAQQLYNQYSAAGPLTPQQVQDQLSNTPGYQFTLNQGIGAIQNAASAAGSLGSGRMMQSLTNYASGLASQTYQQQIQNLMTLAQNGQQAATGVSTLGNQQSQTQAGLQSNLADTIANSYLAAGNATGQALEAANPQFQILGQQQTSSLGGLGSILGGVGSLLGGGGGGGAAGGLGGLFGALL